MAARIVTSMTIGLLVIATSVFGQTTPWQGASAPPRARVGQPQGPMQPQHPTLRRRAAPNQPLRAPFVLSPQEQAQVNSVLNAWEYHSNKVKNFRCNFIRYEYGGVFDKGQEKALQTKGIIQYEKPDKGLFEVAGDRPEKWIADGKSIYSYDFAGKQLIEMPLPPELQGKPIADGPLPFIFGAKAENLKKRYFIRIATPEDERVKGKVWLEAYPRFQADAAQFKQSIVVMSLREMVPSAMKTFSPNGEQSTSYAFSDIQINRRASLLGPLFEKKPFVAKLPHGWEKIVEQVPNRTGRQATAGAGATRR